jgi:hypothetical protein
MELRRVYCHGFHHTDRYGRPIYIERLGHVDVDAMFTVSNHDRLVRYYTRIYESLLKDKFDKCSQAHGHRVEQYISIFDLSGVTMKIMDKRIRHMLTVASKIT